MIGTVTFDRGSLSMVERDASRGVGVWGTELPVSLEDMLYHDIEEVTVEEEVYSCFSFFVFLLQEIFCWLVASL